MDKKASSLAAFAQPKKNASRLQPVEKENLKQIADPIDIDDDVEDDDPESATQQLK